MKYRAAVNRRDAVDLVLPGLAPGESTELSIGEESVEVCWVSESEGVVELEVRDTHLCYRELAARIEGLDEIGRDLHRRLAAGTRGRLVGRPSRVLVERARGPRGVVSARSEPDLKYSPRLNFGRIHPLRTVKCFHGCASRCLHTRNGTTRTLPTKFETTRTPRRPRYR